jgi:hypothetical protein
MHGSVEHRPVVADFDVQGIEEHDGIHRLLRAGWQAATSATTASVIVLMSSGETSTAYASARNA